MPSFIAYLRVSTIRQGESGLGLEAQAAAISRHVGNGTLLQTFTEVESGKRCNRPQLAAALELAKRTGSTLVVAKLDRLARDVQFIAGLMNSGVDFVACDQPFATRLTLHILAAVAEDEARRISERTKAALGAAKARGVVLGGFRGRALDASQQSRGREAQTTAAIARATGLSPLLDELRAIGATTLQALADGLNARGYRTARGGSWSAAQVRREVVRIAA